MTPSISNTTSLEEQFKDDISFLTQALSKLCITYKLDYEVYHIGMEIFYKYINRKNIDWKNPYNKINKKSLVLLAYCSVYIASKVWCDSEFDRQIGYKHFMKNLNYFNRKKIRAKFFSIEIDILKELEYHVTFSPNYNHLATLLSDTKIQFDEFCRNNYSYFTDEEINAKFCYVSEFCFAVSQICISFTHESMCFDPLEFTQAIYHYSFQQFGIDILFKENGRNFSSLLEYVRNLMKTEYAVSEIKNIIRRLKNT
ncbi:hypothetical protein OAG24_00380 [bacterium]|nr:hypothetical protein [bacterium]